MYNFLIQIFNFFRIFVGIKKLLALVDMARQTNPQIRVSHFLSTLEEEGCLSDTGNR